MAYLGTTHLDRRPAAETPPPRRADAGFRPALQTEIDRRRQQVQQMLLAGTMAAGAIIVVAGVMLLRLL